MMSNKSQERRVAQEKTYSHIFQLLERLCESIAGPDADVTLMRSLTEHIVTSPSMMRKTTDLDETTLITGIMEQLKKTPTNNLDVSEDLSSKMLEQQETSVSVFRKLYAEMNKDQKNCIPVLTLLLALANSKYIKYKSNLAQNLMATCTAVTTNPTNSMLRYHMSQSNFSQALLPKASSTVISVGNSKNKEAERLLTLAKPSMHNVFNTELDDDLVREVIYCFTGSAGKHLKKDSLSYTFRLDVRAKQLRCVDAGMLLKLSKLGYYYLKASSYTNPKLAKGALGLMGQALTSAIKKELTRYVGLVAIMQEQYNKEKALEQSTYRNGGIPTKKHLTLMKLLLWYEEPLDRLRWLVNMCELCKEKKGGTLATTLSDLLVNGTAKVQNMAKSLLVAVCAPLYEMITQWMLEGELRDPHAEFFIECLAEVPADHFWVDKYRVRKAMLPDFISIEMANKILATGKSINFLHEICGDKTPIQGRDELRKCINDNAAHIFDFVPDTKLHDLISSVYLQTSKRVLDIVMGPFRFLEHLQAMRNYLLLGKGDFVCILMKNLSTELDKPGKELYSHDLTAIMDAAIRATTRDVEEPDILKYLDMRLVAPMDGDIGWDIVSLQYTVNGPLTAMLKPSMAIYQMLFKPLWRMKHIEFIVSYQIWSNNKSNSKLLNPMMHEIGDTLYRLHLYTSEMTHFIHQIQYYMLFEVIECSWSLMEAQVRDAKSLDEVLYAHDEFLRILKRGAFLDTESTDIHHSLNKVYEAITRMDLWQKKFYSICFKELESRRQHRASIKASEATGAFGLTVEKQLNRDQELKIFEQHLGSYQKSLSNIGVDYEKAVHNFVLTLHSTNDPNLQVFGTRLDFNEYYKKLNTELQAPLTFVNMRNSNVFSSVNTKSNVRFSMAN